MPESSLRKPRRAPTRKTTVGPPLPAGQPIPRGAAKSRVDDRIKKRMSMRYAEMVTSPTDGSAIPPMPGLPPALVAGGIMSLGAGANLMRDDFSGAKSLDDKRILEAEQFDPDAYLRLKLANSTGAELRSLQSSLNGIKEETSTELQRNVFKNYAEFVLISKEITSLEAEMIELKDLLSEYKSMPSVLHIPDPTNHSANSTIMSAYKRSSIADLRVMYFNQMQELHAHIEGAAKFAPTTPGRHVVFEMEGVLSLNAATYKVVGRVRFVVLDDLVLVARRRRRKAAGEASGSGSGTINEGKLVAEKCWPLSEMLVLDTKDSPRMTNVFKIRHGKETHVYRTETPQDKKTLITQFRVVADELIAKKRKEREGEHERRKSMWQAGAGDRSSLGAVPDWMAELAVRGGELPGVELESGAKEKAERDARWVGEWADDLTVAIALREWEKAVTLVEDGQAKLSTMAPLAQKLPALNNLLTKSLLDSLSLATNRKSTVVSLVSYLLRLKAGPAARSTLLQMRTKVLKAHVRKITFEGDIGAYVGDLAIVYFTGLRHTADWFLASFKENEVASSLIQWARRQIEDFAENFRKQVFTSDVDPKVVNNALEITYTQSKKLLQEYGLDFRFLLEELLVAKPKENIKSISHFSFQDYQHPKIEPVPTSRRRTPAPSNNPPENISPVHVDSLAPPSSAAPKRSPGGNNLSQSSYSAMSSSFKDVPDRGASRTPTSAAPRPGTPVSTRAHTPISPLPTRSRTPVTGTGTPRSARYPTPRAAQAQPPPLSAQEQSPPLVSPRPRYGNSPPSSPAFSRTRDREQERDNDWTSASDRERSRAAGNSSPAPPPRSTNRPSSIQRLPQVVVSQREGMI